MLAGELATSHESSAAERTERLYAWRTLEWAKHRRATLQIIIVQKSILLSSHRKALINVAMNRARIRGNYKEVFCSKQITILHFVQKISIYTYIRSSRASLQTSRLKMRQKKLETATRFPFYRRHSAARYCRRILISYFIRCDHFSIRLQNPNMSRVSIENQINVHTNALTRSSDDDCGDFRVSTHTHRPWRILEIHI